MNKAFRFLIQPKEAQQKLLAKTFGCVRFLYNAMLRDKIDHYEMYKEPLHNTPAQYKKEFPWLKEVDSLALCNAQLHLEAAFRNFFHDQKAGFPKFKRKHSGRDSYTTNLVNNNILLGDGYLKLPKLGKMKIRQHRQIPADYRLKSVTISKDATGKYYASLLYEYEADIPQVSINKVLGLDFSMQELYVDSYGNRAGYPQFYRKSQEKLKKEQRKLARRKPGSANWKKQKKRVAKHHKHVANQRSDFQHKQSRRIANSFDAVFIEDLNMKAMSQALRFGKSVADNGWGAFTRKLEYKLREQGKQLVKIDRFYPSSKRCSQCGKVKDTLPLSQRTYTCDCGFVCDRDVNAAVNIKNEGLRIITV